MRSSVTVGLCSLVLGLSVSGCKAKSSAPAKASASASASASAKATPRAATEPAPSTPPTRPPPSLPEGPSLAILAGKGVGSIRLGATVATIERQMGKPCEVKRADLCRYIVRAVEFHLNDAGITDRIVVHRHERPAGVDAAGKPAIYGFFNGGIPPGAGLGMIPSAVVEIIGKPTRSEAVEGENDNHTVERAFYPGMTLEYDRYTNGKIMLGAVIIEKEKK